jgi:predicted N-acetyltransferase YhbS
MTNIRLMRKEDADAVRQVEAAAFGKWRQQVTGQSAELPQRTLVNVLACREKDPAGAFVAEEEGGVVGFVFSRTWGSVGWFGTFAVLPKCQQRGIGKKLISASLEYLGRAADRVIGLETMPDSPYNLGLYLRQGFRACAPTLTLNKTLRESASQDVSLARWSAADAQTRERWLADLRQASGQILAGLDYSKEILSTARYRLGDTLVLCQELQAVGFSNVRLVSSHESWGEELAVVQVMALHPACTNDEALHALLDCSEALAAAQGKRTLVVAVNACHTWALERLLARDYRVSRTMIRMVLKRTEAGSVTDAHVDFSRWAG